MYEKLLKEIKNNRLKIIFFLMGYFLIVLDYEMLENIQNIFKNIEIFYLIVSNLLYVLLVYWILKKISQIYLDIVIISNDKLYIKIFKYLKIISLGSFIGFISMIFQAYVIVLLPF